MAQRDVVWTKTADIQFAGILEYWAKKNKSNVYSKKLLNSVNKRVIQISESPFIYKSTSFKSIRVASMGNFSIFYKIGKSQIIVMAFWDNRQDPKKLLKALQQRI